MKGLIKKFIPTFLIDLYHWFLPFLGAILYRFPSRKIKVIGVTGTNGKSTVVELITKILEEAGHKTASLSSIKFKIGQKEWLNTLKMTMPGRLTLQKFLRKAVDTGCQYAVLEVTSEGIKQYRHKFIDFEVAVFTNLTPEHIEAHGGFEDYRSAKGKLFRATKKIHILNLDDENTGYFLQFPAKKKYGYGLKIFNFQFPIFNQFSISNEFSIFNFQKIIAQNPQALDNGVSFSVNGVKFDLKLLGEFNIYNSLAAICVGLYQGIDLETCKSALGKIEEIPGRMELVISQPFKVFVDYAFTPNALEKVYQTLSSKFQVPPKESQRLPTGQASSKLICVLGACGGGRDKWKRPVLGEIAGKYCDEVIVTNEDPYDENPMEIIEQVAKGAGNKAKKILDRREAIRKSLILAEKNDTVIITGKGCEPWICVARGERIHWDDRQVMREEFAKLKTFPASKT